MGRTYKPKLLRIYGKRRVSVHRNDGIYDEISIGRLILMAFIGPAPEGKPFALHRDDDTTNNCLVNLYWGNKSDNSLDAFRNGKNQINTIKISASLMGHKTSQKTRDKISRTLKERNARKMIPGEAIADLPEGYAL